MFTVRTKRLSQLLRLNRTAFLNIVQASVGDGTIIMNNLLQVSRKFSIIITMIITISFVFAIDLKLCFLYCSLPFFFTKKEKQIKYSTPVLLQS